MPQPVRVGIADDDAIIRVALGAALRKIPGVRLVQAVEDGAAAVTLATSGEIDLLVLDIEMPVMNGPQALAQIRTLAPSVQVIILSSFPASMKAAEMVSAGACAYLEKPCDIEQLRQLIETVCIT